MDAGTNDRDSAAWAAITEREGRTLLDTARRNPDAPVPAVPGWTSTDLIRHAGLLLTRTSIILRSETMERPSRRNGLLPDPPEEGLADWAGQALTDLVADLRAIDDPDRPVYSVSPEHARAGFWSRRMAHETTMHRVDAEQAAGGPVGEIDPALAVDAIDETFSVFVLALAADARGNGETVHLHATDTEGEWLVTLGAEGVSVTSGHAKGDAAVRGPAGGLLLWLWGRAPLDDLELFGDRAAAEALRQVTTF